MSKMSPEELFRRAAEAEGGMPVSAGARANNAFFYVDLSPVPEVKRGALVAQIKELVSRASVPDGREDTRAGCSSGMSR